MEYGNVIYGGAKGRFIEKLQNAQNRILRTCIYSNEYIEKEQLYALYKTSKLDVRRNMQLNLFMFKQKGNIEIVNRRRVNTRGHDALLFVTKIPTMRNINKMFSIEAHLAGITCNH